MSKKGVILTFDFVIKNLEKYYSYKSPKNAYREIGKFLIENGFEKTRDSDYVSDKYNRLNAIGILDEFSKNNKWFSLCISKVSVAPIDSSWELSDLFQKDIDMDFKLEKDRQYEELVNKESKNQSNTQLKSSLLKRIKNKNDILDASRKANNISKNNTKER
jgi:vapD